MTDISENSTPHPRLSGQGPSLLVVGGGAAGFFCAVNAARLNPALQVTILEKSTRVLAKVRVSGGGRCNVTHACFDNTALLKNYPRGKNFLKKTFHWFAPGDTVEWFAQRGVGLKIEADGRIFPVTNQSQSIIDCLLKEADRYGVRVQLQTGVEAIQPSENGFNLETSRGPLSSTFVCIACGGFPKSGQFDWLRSLGHTVVDPVPSLFTCNIPGNPVTSLMGVSVGRVRVKIAGTPLEEEGPLLITHWGMSGPAILRLSAAGARTLAEMQYRFDLRVNWLPDYREQQLRDRWHPLRNEFAAQKIGGKNPFGLPGRLWNYLLEQSGISPGIRWSELVSAQQQKLIQLLSGQVFQVLGKTTFKEEFVTCGGISLSEIDPNTMESRIVPKLYFAGEIMDVDGVTGGFNFQHAWTSGWLGARSIAGSATPSPDKVQIVP